MQLAVLSTSPGSTNPKQAAAPIKKPRHCTLRRQIPSDAFDCDTLVFSCRCLWTLDSIPNTLMLSVHLL